MTGDRRAGNRQDGLAALGLLGPVVGALLVALVVVVDVGAYLDAASRAQAAADAGALAAAVAVHPRAFGQGDPTAAARAQVVASGGQLVRCDCRAGARRSVVVARMPVGGLVLPRVWARAVDAEAAATSTWERR